jgi:hypothetical protein
MSYTLHNKVACRHHPLALRRVTPERYLGKIIALVGDPKEQKIAGGTYIFATPHGLLIGCNAEDLTHLEPHEFTALQELEDQAVKDNFGLYGGDHALNFFPLHAMRKRK